MFKMKSSKKDNLPTKTDNAIPEGHEHPTDPSELRPSLNPEDVTYANILATHQAVLGELQSVRLDFAEFKKDVQQIREMFNKFKADLSKKPDWVVELFKSFKTLDGRIKKLELAVSTQEKFCKAQHSNGADKAATG